MAKRTKTIADLDDAEKRWKTRLKRAVGAIAKIDAQRKRAAKAANTPQRAVTMIAVAAPDRPAPDPVPEPVIAPAAPAAVAAPASDGFDIPGFLRRARGTPEQQAEAQVRKADREAAEAIRAEQAEKAKAKARGRIATMKAKKAGDTKRMPLTGKAALDMIRNG